jgi:hypothetical protein
VKPLVYFAGPISSDPFRHLRDATRLYSRTIRDGVVVAFSPHQGFVVNVQREVPYEEWMAYDFAVIRHCDALFRMKGASPGADREVELANELGIPVFTDLAALYAWAEAEYVPRPRRGRRRKVTA